MPYVLKPESRGSWFPDEQCTTLRPPLTAPNRSHLKYDPFCSLMIYVTHDRTRVFVGVGHPSDRIARPADDVEIEALADRFHLQELRQVLERRRAAASPTSGHVR